MRSAWPLLLLCAITLACADRRPGEDSIADTGSSETSTEDSGSSDSSATSTDVETGPFPDLPSELPADCEPIFIHAPDPNPGLTDIWSGWFQCNETDFRIEPVDCPYAAPFEACDTCGGCSDDEECLEHYPSGSCFCGHNCNTDSDCAPNEVCVCRSSIGYGSNNECVPADCTGEADCGLVPNDGVPRCRLDTLVCGVPRQVSCRTADDECTFDTECPCGWDQSEMAWTCGRPIICE